MGFPGGTNGKESHPPQLPHPHTHRINAGNLRDTGSTLFPWIRKILCMRAWQSTPVFLPGESPWTEEPGGLWSIGSQRGEHD